MTGLRRWGEVGPWPEGLALAGVIALVVLAYARTAGFDFVWDDHVLVVTNPALRGRVAWWEVFLSPTSAFLGRQPGADQVYRPLLAASVAMDRALWGLAPGGSHLTNVALHLGVVTLVFFLGRLLGRHWTAGAASAGLLAVHPSAVEAVTFVSARMDLVVALGFTAGLLFLHRATEPGRGWRAALGLLSFLVALGAKETAMVFPLILTWAALVMPREYAGVAGGARQVLCTRSVVSAWATLGLYIAFRKAMVGALASNALGLAALPAQALRALVAVGANVQMTIIPSPNTGPFEPPPPSGLADPRVVWGLFVVLALASGLPLVRRRHPPSAVGLGWYVAALLPVANLTPVYGPETIYLAERSLYPALAGWCLLLGVGGRALLAAWTTRGGRRGALAWVVSLGVLATFLGVTSLKVGAWRDDVSLWTAALLQNPSSLTPRLNLSAALARRGAVGEAEAVAAEAEGRFPASPELAYLHGWLADQRGDAAAVLAHYERAVRLGMREGHAFRQVATLSALRGDVDRAQRWFEEAARTFPTRAWPQEGLAWCWRRRGREDLARTHSDRAKALEPHSPEPSWLRGQLLAAEGRAAEAIRAFQESVSLDPTFVPAHRELALLYERAGRLGEARTAWRRIAEALPSSYGQEAVEHVRRLGGIASGAQGSSGGVPDP